MGLSRLHAEKAEGQMSLHFFAHSRVTTGMTMGLRLVFLNR